jgi:hypothetical protein
MSGAVFPCKGAACHAIYHDKTAATGPRYVLFCGIIQYLNLVATGIGYTVTSGNDPRLRILFLVVCLKYEEINL